MSAENNRERQILDRLGDVELQAVAELGRVELSLSEAMGLRVGDVLPSNRVEDADLRLNGVLFAKGEITPIYRSSHFRIDRLVGANKEMGDG